MRRHDGITAPRLSRLLYNGDEGSLVLSTDGTFLLSDIQDGALLCEKIRTLCPAAPKLFTVKVTMPQQR